MEMKTDNRPDGRAGENETPRFSQNAQDDTLVYGKNPVTELLKSGAGVDTVLLAEGMAMRWPLARRVAVARGGWLRLSCYPPEPAWLLALEGADA